MSAAAPRHIISKGLDPVFAIGVGLTAAYLKISREEKEKGRTPQQSVESLKKRAGIAWEEVLGKSTVG